HVESGSVILELTSPELEQTAHDAELQSTAAEAELTTLRATLQRGLLDQEATTAKVKSDYEQAKMERETNDQLAKNGLIAELQYKTSKVQEAELANRNEIEKKRLQFAHESIDPQLASKQAAVDQAKQLRPSERGFLSSWSSTRSIAPMPERRRSSTRSTNCSWTSTPTKARSNFPSCTATPGRGAPLRTPTTRVWTSSRCSTRSSNASQLRAMTRRTLCRRWSRTSMPRRTWAVS